MLLLPDGPKGKAWEFSKRNACSEIGKHWTENSFHFFCKGLITICHFRSTLTVRGKEHDHWN
jgi:hypothetical protein